MCLSFPLLAPIFVFACGSGSSQQDLETSRLNGAIAEAENQTETECGKGFPGHGEAWYFAHCPAPTNIQCTAVKTAELTYLATCNNGTTYTVVLGPGEGETGLCDSFGWHPSATQDAQQRAAEAEEMACLNVYYHDTITLR
jgi:hypothetical protein